MTIVPEKIVAARAAKGWSQKELAQRAEVSQQTVGKLEAGTARTSKFLTRIAAALEVAPGDLDSDYRGLTPSSTAGVFRPLPEILGARDLPVFSAVEGGPGEMVVSTDPIDWVPRPWFLKEVREGYAVVVTGESMVPVYEPGDIVIVNPRLPAIPNKNAIFVGGEQHGDFVATVKRLLRSTVSDWHVRQHNPPPGGLAEFVLPKQTWRRALRIVGKYEGG